MEALRREGVVHPQATVTVLEISKSAPVSLRLFEVRVQPDKPERTYNPPVGLYRIVGDDGYICATGDPFLPQGTAKPLHVCKVLGPLSMKAALEDVYALTVLASWTRPEGVTRYPLTIKLCDRLLEAEAGVFDEHAFEVEATLASAMSVANQS